MNLTISRRIGKFAFDRRVLALLVLLGLLVAGRSWLADHPEHNPWVPLDLDHPSGWATERKLLALRDDVPACRAVLERSDVAFNALDPVGEGECRRDDRTQLVGYPLSPDTPATTCPVAVAMELWKRDSLDPVAEEIFGSRVERIEHMGAYSCRRMYGRDEGPWSEHATANALDIGGFVLEDGTRISVLGDWPEDGEKQRFLREVRDGACTVFATVLSPDYNAAHADHFHFDMDDRWTSVCR
ncbi:extensin-like domain-containing protein [Qipengyuania aquimaris]|uniref:extensin-like domain-containing protein n=1 Tax=Qipengyuania aquimaris TaxID=255984 RepID=UPI001FD37794|nr:extensin family protein [Qipengyuania aquimaris]UOR14562.1 extensin family protein [Qipengyuania aquimaris]